MFVPTCRFKWGHIWPKYLFKIRCWQLSIVSPDKSCSPWHMGFVDSDMKIGEPTWSRLRFIGDIFESIDFLCSNFNGASQWNDFHSELFSVNLNIFRNKSNRISFEQKSRRTVLMNCKTKFQCEKLQDINISTHLWTAGRTMERKINHIQSFVHKSNTKLFNRSDYFRRHSELKM